MQPEIYLDANATSPVLPAAINAAVRAMTDGFGNPSSSHATGMRAKALLDSVRERACRLLGVGNGRLTFTSGATEGIQTAVLSALCAIRERRAAGERVGDLLLYGATEHKAVPESLAHWNTLLGLGLEMRALPVDSTGRHRLDVLRELAPRAAMVCTMAANNETGVISDLDAISDVLAQHAPRAYWMVDSVQALGKMHIALATTRIDYAPFSGHKLYAPKGIGMLYVRDGAPYTSLMCGGGQEAGQRAGTENMTGVAALGAVLEALEDGYSFRQHEELVQFRDQLAESLRSALPGLVFNASFDCTLPTTLNFSVPGFSSKELLDLFDAGGVRVSSGSACSSAKAAPSYVLQAMDLPAWRCAAAVRMSFGPMADADFIDAACDRILHCGDALRTSCLVPSSVPAESRDGVIQMSADGASTWLVLDAESQGCIVIDPLEALNARIASFVCCQGYTVRAVLGTHGDGRARADLLARIAPQLDRAGSSDRFGWPDDCDGEHTITLGGRVLARLPQAGSAAYLLGAVSAGPGAAPDFAFTGMAPVDDLAGSIGATTIVCPAAGDTSMSCTTLAAERGECCTEVQQHELNEPELVDFLDTHPDAMLIDVREAFEHAAAASTAWRGRTAHSVPLSRLADRLAVWLRAEQRPLVFFCRSGARGAKAAHCLQRLGYRNAWHVTGGLSN